MAMILGKKVGMTRLYNQAGELLPVTVIQAGPCTIMQVKSKATDGYSAVQLGYDDVKPSRRKKPQLGHAQKAKTAPKRFVREMRLPDAAEPEYKTGDAVTVSVFAENEVVDVIGTSKGRGFAGAMKRHGFSGFPATHGTERKHRAPGSLSSFASDAGRTGGPKKGKKMAGHTGNQRVTTRNHRVVTVDQEQNLLVIKGCIPGPAGGYCVVRSSRSPK